MPIDKFNSENRRSSEWQEHTEPRQDIVREAAGFTERSHDIQCTLASNKDHEDEFNSESATNMEPAMSRRKQYIDPNHSHHDFILGDDGGGFDNVVGEAAGFTERSHDIQCTLASNKDHEDEFNSESDANMEPAISRRRQYPDLVNSHHDFILGDDGGSFDNVDSRARPHSENRSHYRWHEQTGPKQEVVREAAGFTERCHDIQYTLSSSKDHENEFNSDSATNMEPAMSRRKQYFDPIHSHHDFILGDDGGSFDNKVGEAAGFTERSHDIQPTLASNKDHEDEFSSEFDAIMDLAISRRRQYPNLVNSHHDFILGDYGGSFDNVDSRARERSGENKVNSKMNPSEYSLQFAWPQDSPATRRDAAGSAPRNSKSMDG